MMEAVGDNSECFPPWAMEAWLKHLWSNHEPGVWAEDENKDKR